MSKLSANQLQNRTSLYARVFALALLAFAIATLPGVARADSNNAYQISGTTASGGAISGTLDFSYNSNTKQTLLINSNFTVDGKSYTCNGLTGGNQCIVFDPYGTEYLGVISGTTFVILEWTGFNLAGTFPSTINFIGGYVEPLGGGTWDFVTGGTATIIPTPEPSAVFLLGAGLLGLVALSRRRLNFNSIA
jgi:PEP-CTERM motif-containing protein